MKNIVCFGEVLWDVFPDIKRIGGAPLNVAFRLRYLHNNVSIITRVGKDFDGEKLRNQIKLYGIDVANVQTDVNLSTGEVLIRLNEKDVVDYDVSHPSAWDAIQATNEAKSIVVGADAFVFGSLAARSVSSRETLYRLLKLAKYKVLDINLREPYYAVDVLAYLMSEADLIKFNHNELIEVVRLLKSDFSSLEESIKFIVKETNTPSICVTLGSNGAVLYCNDTFYYSEGYEVFVQDTVGAGDSFLASLLDGILKGVLPQRSLDLANAVGALVVGSKGANPDIVEKDIRGLIDIRNSNS